MNKNKENNRIRLAVFRSSKHIYAQLINDLSMITLAAADDRSIDEKINKTERAIKVGQDIATKAAKLKIDMVRFDRGGFHYQGRVKALADSARAQGLKF